MNVISFSLYGADPKYTQGMLANALLAREHYPGWQVRVHHDSSVPAGALRGLEALGASLVDMEGDPLPGMFWRFLPFDSVDRLVVRDADSRLSARERLAVDEWVADGTALHVMRDHPHHTFIMMGGMWGLRPDRDMRPLAAGYLRGRELARDARGVDQEFLRDVVYPAYSHDSTVHVSLPELRAEAHAQPFPSRLEDHRFVGEIYGADGSRDYQWGLWPGRAGDELLRG